MSHVFQTVGVVSAPYRDKFGVPRQPALAPAAETCITLLPPYDHPDMVRGLEAFSHIWVQFVFNLTAGRGWKPLVRPPRLGGNARVGVFASRATHRPNPVGLSLCRLTRIDTEGGVRLYLSGADLVDGTPVLDIKPYIPFVESVPDARSGFVDGPPPELAVAWTPEAAAALQALHPDPDALRPLIGQILAQDPRPAYQDDPNRRYGIRLHDLDIRFRVEGRTARVLEIVRIAQN